MTWPSAPDPRASAAFALAEVDAALAHGQVTTAEPESRALQSFALALRDAQPRPGPAFLAQLDRSMQAQLTPVVDAAAAAPSPEPDRAVIRVLVAVAHPLLRGALTWCLEHSGRIEVVAETGDAEMAMKLALSEHPDVVLVEAGMPGPGAAVVVGRLRSELPNVRALVLTVGPPSKGVLAAIGAGAVGWVPKDSPGPELPSAVIAAYEGRPVISRQLDHTDGDEASVTLTAREREILQLLACGARTEELAERFRLSPRRMDGVLARLSRKLTPEASPEGTWAALRRRATR